MEAMERLISKNVETIQSMLDNLSELHRVWMKFVDPTGAYILTPRYRPQCYLCSLIRSHPEGFEKCRQSAIRAGSSSTGGSCVYRCHAGLLIMAVPLFIGHECIGAMATGEIRTAIPGERQGIIKMADRLGFHVEKALQYYEEIPVKKEQEITLLGNTLFDICRCLLRLGSQNDAFAGRDEQPDNMGLTRGELLIRDAVVYMV